jgi:hypothetical protein
MKRSRERGQAILLAVVALGIVLAGAMGLAIDTGELYSYRQMAQAGADASALAGATSILGNTNIQVGGVDNRFGTATFTCTNGTDIRTPCAYARSHGFGITGSSDIISVDFPTTVNGVTLSPTVTPSAVHVLITHPVPVSFLRLLGAASTRNIRASATAAIVQVISPVPILVLHPSDTSSFNVQGTPNIQICGGPQLSIQVNSRSTTGAAGGGSAFVDLSKGGPSDTTGTCGGTGSDFGTFGGPTSKPGWVSNGSTGNYIQPSLPISDPFAQVDPPGSGSNSWTSPRTCNPQSACYSVVTAGTGDCPSGAKKPCNLYLPGTYPAGIQIKNEYGIFTPGVYKITGGTNGFSNDANGIMLMCSACSADASSFGTGNTGMLVYIAAGAGTFNVGSNSDASLVGSSQSSSYKGILFFKDRAETSQLDHSLGGGGNLSLVGTIYITNTVTAMKTTPTVYQRVTLQGNSGNTTRIRGEIVTGELKLGGTGGITMNLDPNLLLPINRIALVK